MSIVSVHRSAAPPHAGHVHSTHSRSVESGEPADPFSVTPAPPCLPSAPSAAMRMGGRRTGSSPSGTGTSPHLLQLTIGMGVPQ